MAGSELFFDAVWEKNVIQFGKRGERDSTSRGLRNCFMCATEIAIFRHNLDGEYTTSFFFFLRLYVDQSA